MKNLTSCVRLRASPSPKMHSLIQPVMCVLSELMLLTCTAELTPAFLLNSCPSSSSGRMEQ